MNGYKIALLVFFAIAIFATISVIGKPRKSLSPETAAATVLVQATLVVLVVLA